MTFPQKNVKFICYLKFTLDFSEQAAVTKINFGVKNSHNVVLWDGVSRSQIQKKASWKDHFGEYDL
jgi:hypothetical protein